VSEPTSILSRLLGRIRLLGHRCPRCNSDAPNVDTCAVCRHRACGGNRWLVYRREHYPPSRATKALWWYRWVDGGWASPCGRAEDSIRERQQYVGSGSRAKAKEEVRGE